MTDINQVVGNTLDSQNKAHTSQPEASSNLKELFQSNLKN